MKRTHRAGVTAPTDLGAALAVIPPEAWREVVHELGDEGRAASLQAEYRRFSALREALDRVMDTP